MAGHAAMRGAVLRHRGGHDGEAHDAAQHDDGRADGDPERPVGDADEPIDNREDEGIVLAGGEQLAEALA